MSFFDYAAFHAEFPWFFAICAGVFGAMVGSFLNVVIYRLPLGKSIVTPGSHCACGQPIKWYDNIPVFSWFILRGRARCCGQPYSFRYPFVELLTAGLFLACWLLFPPAKAFCGMLFMSALIAGTFTDLDHMIIPDEFTIGLGSVGVVLSFAVPSLHGFSSGDFLADGLRAMITSLQGLLIGAGLVVWVALTAEAVLKKDAMGFGDVKLVGAIGAFTGWQGTVTALFGGAVVGCIWFIVAWVWQKCAGKSSQTILKTADAEGGEAELAMGAHVPFVPMLAIAGAAHFLWAHAWVAEYFSQLSVLL